MRNAPANLVLVPAFHLAFIILGLEGSAFVVVFLTFGNGDGNLTETFIIDNKLHRPNGESLSAGFYNCFLYPTPVQQQPSGPLSDVV